MARFKLILPAALRLELLVYAREACPEEACGFLIGAPMDDNAWRVLAVRRARNLHPEREGRFLLDPLEYRKAEDCAHKREEEGGRVLGFWHSHPHGPVRPSKVDLEEARGLYGSFPQRYLYLILSFRDSGAEDLGCWRLDERGRNFTAVETAGE